MEQEKGFFANLVDFSFTQFITTKIIGVLYGLTVLFAFLFAIAAIVGAFSQSAIYGIVALAISPLWLLIVIVVARVVSEIIVAIVSVAEDIGYIARKTQEITQARENSGA
ncbi:MAG: DUF4282 domain-containing protein [Dehalococcoidia bacterium]